MIKRKGKLLPRHHEQLGSENPKYDTRDIPLRITKGVETDEIHISDCYMPIQYRGGGLKARKVSVCRFVNDGFTFWTGNIDIGQLKVINDLPFTYTRRNHNDCIHGQTGNNKKHVRIRKAIFECTGKGAEKKGLFMLSETSINSHFRLFEDGYIVSGYSQAPALNANNLRHSVLGSPECPLDGELLSKRPIRIMGRKPNSPESFDNVIHCYADVTLELDDSAKKGTIVRRYKRGWTKQERLDNWQVAKGALDLLG